MNLQDYLLIKAAADFLGVSVNTLRNWEHAGKLVPARHPINGYRLYRRDELEALLGKLVSATPPQAEQPPNRKAAGRR